MTTATTLPPVSSFNHIARQRRLEARLRALCAPGWGKSGLQQPLATHMATQRLVRARGYAGAPVGTPAHPSVRRRTRPTCGCRAAA